MSLNHSFDTSFLYLHSLRPKKKNPKLPSKSILTSLLPLPALAPPPPLSPPPAPMCVWTPGSHSSEDLPSCTVSIKHHLWALFFFFFYKPFFIGLGLCLLLTVTVQEWLTVLCVHCHISPSSMSPDKEASTGNRLYSLQHTNSHLSVLLLVIYCDFSSAELM